MEKFLDAIIITNASGIGKTTIFPILIDNLKKHL